MSKPVKWDQEYEQLGGAIEMAEMDASNTDMSCDDEKLVEYYFKQAAQHLALTKSDPDIAQSICKRDLTTWGRQEG